MFGNWKNWFADAPVDTGVNLSSISLEYSKEELARATKGFNQSEVLGSGNYGAVYRGVMRDGSEVAIKFMEVDENASSDSGFMDEVKCLSKFRHPNLVTLMGWGRDKGQRFIVYELLVGGDVSKRLKGAQRGENFDWSERLSVALDAASGLSHMHNSTPKAFHRDIKSANILLDRNGTAKMADFGLSLINKKSKERLDMTVEHISGTPGYACPLYIKTGRITEQTEVFAFGMVTLELLLNTAPACMGQNGCILYPIFQTLMPQVPGARERALAAVDPAAKWPPAIAGGLVDLALLCTSIEEVKRPDFIKVLQSLRPMCDQYLGNGRRRSTAEFGGMNAQAPPPGASGYGGPPGPTPQAHHAHHAPSGTAPPVGAGYDEPTRPQLGLGCSPPIEGGTRPQLGVSGPPGGSADPTTNPQLQYANIPGMTVPATTGPSHIGHDARAACPKTAVAPPGSQRQAPSSQGGHNVAADPFMVAAAPTNIAEVVLSCTYAAGLDVSSIPDKHRCHTFKLGEMGPPWSFGRQQQPQLFARLVKDEALRSCISRSHLELIWEAPNLLLKKLSPNPLLVNGKAVPQAPIPLANGAQLGFCPAVAPEANGAGTHPPFLVFSVQIRDAATVAAIGPTALPTKPDLPIPQHVAKEMQLRHQQQQQQALLQKQQPHASLAPQQQLRVILTCCMALDATGGERHLESMSRDMRSILVPPDGRLSVGRQCQQGFFEGLLGTESMFLTFISRQHFELAAIASDPGAFDVTNNSANPLVVNGKQIEKGHSCQLRLPGGIDFISKAMSAAGSQVFLRLRVEAQAHQNSQSISDMGQMQMPVSVKASPAPPQPSAAGHSSREGPFWLELGGTACKPDFLPTASSRRVIGTEAGLNVGRTHQGPLLLEALKDGVMQFVSREHFKIEPGIQAGQFQFVPLSANPMWRLRDGASVDATKGQPSSLEPGDSILLFTGASDRTPDGPGSQGLLFFRFGDPWMPQAQDSTDLRAAIRQLEARLDQPERFSVPTPNALIPQPLAEAYTPVPQIQEPGTGAFNADGTPFAPAHHQAGHQVARPPANNTALRPPIDASNYIDEDELMGARKIDIGSLDFEGGKGATDAFSKSGFSYNR